MSNKKVTLDFFKEQIKKIKKQSLTISQIIEKQNHEGLSVIKNKSLTKDDLNRIGTGLSMPSNINQKFLSELLLILKDKKINSLYVFDSEVPLYALPFHNDHLTSHLETFFEVLHNVKFKTKPVQVGTVAQCEIPIQVRTLYSNHFDTKLTAKLLTREAFYLMKTDDTVNARKKEFRTLYKGLSTAEKSGFLKMIKEETRHFSNQGPIVTENLTPLYNKMLDLCSYPAEYKLDKKIELKTSELKSRIDVLIENEVLAGVKNSNQNSTKRKIALL